MKMFLLFAALALGAAAALHAIRTAAAPVTAIIGHPRPIRKPLGAFPGSSPKHRASFITNSRGRP